VARVAGSGWFAAPDAVFDDARLTPVERIVLLYLYRMAGNDGASFPSYNRIAECAGVNRRTAIRAVKSLVEKGWLEVAHRRRADDEAWQSNVYRLTRPARTPSDTESPPSDKVTPPSDTESLAPSDTGPLPSDTAPPEGRPSYGQPEKELPPSLLTQGFPPQGEAPAAGQGKVRRIVPYEAIKDAWNEIAEGTRMPKVRILDDKRKEAMRKRCEALAKHFGDKVYTVEWWRHVFQRVRASPFCRGEGQRGWKASFDWIFMRQHAVIRLLEGFYDDRPSHEKHGVSDWTGQRSGRVDLRAILKAQQGSG